MLNDPPRPTRLGLLRGALLAFAVLTSAAAAVVVGFAAYLFAEGYSGGSSQQSGRKFNDLHHSSVQYGTNLDRVDLAVIASAHVRQ
jgi:hypothetical protein